MAKVLGIVTDANGHMRQLFDDNTVGPALELMGIPGSSWLPTDPPVKYPLSDLKTLEELLELENLSPLLRQVFLLIL